MARRSVLLVALPTVEQLAAGHDHRPPQQRHLVYVKLEDDDGCVGWGECSALNRPTYTSEWATGAFEVLASGAPIDTDRHPMAAAGLAMAELDVDLRRAGQSLAERFGVAGRTVPAGAAVGLPPSGDDASALGETVASVERLITAGIERVKLKIAPGRDLGIVAGLREIFVDLDLQVDANGGYSTGHVEHLQRLRTWGVRVIEQPFAPGDLVSAVALVEAGMTVVADEAATDLETIVMLSETGAASGVAVKPPRFGGLRVAWEVADRCRELGLSVTAGGMLESGLGRHALAVFAAHPACDLTGDVSPARRWLAVDPWPDLELIEGRVVVPSEIGVAGEPDDEILTAHTLTSAEVA